MPLGYRAQNQQCSPATGAPQAGWLVAVQVSRPNSMYLFRVQVLPRFPRSHPFAATPPVSQMADIVLVDCSTPV